MFCIDRLASANYAVRSHFGLNAPKLEVAGLFRASRMICKRELNNPVSTPSYYKLIAALIGRASPDGQLMPRFCTFGQLMVVKGDFCLNQPMKNLRFIVCYGQVIVVTMDTF